MRKTMSALCMLVCLSTATAFSAPKGWYAMFSSGSAGSDGPFEMSEFYDPAYALNLELGYNLTDYLAIVPVDCTFHQYSFNKQKYVDNYWNYRAEYYRLVMENSENSGYSDLSIAPGQLTGFDANSNFSGVAVTPGLRFNLPLTAKMNATLFTGAGIYSTRVSMSMDFIRSIPETGTITDQYSYRDRTRISHFATSFGAGMEYLLTERTGIRLDVNYLRVFTSRVTEPSLNQEALKFYRLGRNGLTYHRFLEDKDTNILEFSAGFKILMY